jgi:hypothetical protein
MVYHALFHPGSHLALLYDDHCPASGHQNALILGKCVHGEPAEQGLIRTRRLGCDRELADLRHLSYITFGTTRSQILCVIEFIESADLI